MDTSNIIGSRSEFKKQFMHALANAHLGLSVSIDDVLDPAEPHCRQYYMNSEPDGGIVFFRTTYERKFDGKDWAIVEKLGDSFTIIASFDEVVIDLVHQGITPDRGWEIYGAPKYVHYDLEFMHEDLRPLFLKHFTDYHCRYSKDELKRKLCPFDLGLIEKWEAWLKPIDTKDEDLSIELPIEMTAALASARLVLSIQIEGLIYEDLEGLMYRIYFASEMEDGRTVYFLNTNELVTRSGFWTNSKKLGSAFTAFFSLEDLIYDLHNYSAAKESRFSIHGPPNYVYYNLLFIDDGLKPIFQKHLNNDVSGYSDDYMNVHFEKEAFERIDKWKKWLN